MAGAASAGAYTAGALDVLFEALDTWYDAKDRGDDVPRHKVSLEVASGASAGAMCAALLAIAAPYDFPHARLNAQREPNAEALRNPFYRAWVEDIGIAPMLDTGDLAGGGMPSLLNSDVIERIVTESLGYSARRRERPYIARPLVTRFTLGNLRGVPYHVTYRGLKPASDVMRAHSDYQGFLVGGAAPAELPPHLWGHPAVCPETASGGSAAWQRLGEAAVASGAFPAFLRAKKLSRPGDDYSRREFGDASAPEGEPRSVCVQPAWKNDTVPSQYDYVSIDGGMFNNEPFALAREVVAGGYGRSNPRQGSAADGAVVMIAPFVSRPGDGEEPAPEPWHNLLMPLFYSFIAQCRFSPADLALAQDESIYSRFLIAPVDSAAPQASPYWIASGPLQGFFGFFHREFRKHDYQLGRRNCQRFLREDFRLPADNPIVANGYAPVSAQQRAAWTDAKGELPIIPLLGPLQQEEPLCDWPAGQFRVDDVMDAVEARVDAVVRYYREAAAASAGGWLARQGARACLSAGWLALRPQVIGSLRQNIEGARRAQLL